MHYGFVAHSLQHHYHQQWLPFKIGPFKAQRPWFHFYNDRDKMYVNNSEIGFSRHRDINRIKILGRDRRALSHFLFRKQLHQSSNNLSSNAFFFNYSFAALVWFLFSGTLTKSSHKSSFCLVFCFFVKRLICNKTFSCHLRGFFIRCHCISFLSR